MTAAYKSPPCPTLDASDGMPLAQIDLGQAELDIATGLMALGPGQAIGRYVIVSVIGCGAMGPTYLASDPSFGLDLVIKEFLPGGLAVRSDGVNVVPRSLDVMVDFACARARFVDEGKRLCKLERAPFIVRALEVIDANGTSYVVFERVVGITLEHRLADGARLKPAEVEHLLTPLLESLQHVHGAELLHGDIRPANIMLTVSNTPRLIDFGDTRAWMPPRFLPAAALSTLGYDPPERITGEDRSAASDIYGLAATLYRAIAGDRPPAAVDRLKEDHYRPLAALDLPGFDRRLLSAIDKAMALPVGDRPSSVAAWRRMFGPTGRTRSPVGKLPDEPASASASPGRLQGMRERVNAGLDGPKRGLWTGVGAIALAAIAVGIIAGGLYLSGDDHPPSAAVTAGGSIGAGPGIGMTQAGLSDPAEAAVLEAKSRALQKDRAATRMALQSIEKEMKQEEQARRDADAKWQAEAKAEADRQAAAAEEAKRRAEAKVEADRQAAAVAEAKRQADAKADADRQAAAAEAKRQADAKAEADRQAAAAEDARRQAAAKAEAAAAVAPPSPDPGAPAPVVQQVTQTAAIQEGAPGLLVRASSGETLQTLYQRVYRGLSPPAFASVAALNPERIRPGDILTFPAPANGWGGHNDANTVSNIR